MVHSCNPSTGKAETGRSPLVQGQPGICSETLSQQFLKNLFEWCFTWQVLFSLYILLVHFRYMLWKHSSSGICEGKALKTYNCPLPVPFSRTHEESRSNNLTGLGLEDWSCRPGPSFISSACDLGASVSSSVKIHQLHGTVPAAWCGLTWRTAFILWSFWSQNNTVILI